VLLLDDPRYSPRVRPLRRAAGVLMIATAALGAVAVAWPLVAALLGVPAVDVPLALAVGTGLAVVVLILIAARRERRELRSADGAGRPTA
jgi:membrane protein implicated in regulation of membrane protease activity